MASSKSDMKDFYKQEKKKKKKKNGTKSKGKSTPTTSSTPKSKENSPALGTLDLKDGFDEKEEMLRQFDMNMAYGPCRGMSRLGRWGHAKALGLNPPDEIEDLLSSSNVRLDCLWDGRV